MPHKRTSFCRQSTKRQDDPPCSASLLARIRYTTIDLNTAFELFLRRDRSCRHNTAAGSSLAPGEHCQSFAITTHVHMIRVMEHPASQGGAALPGSAGMHSARLRKVLNRLQRHATVKSDHKRDRPETPNLLLRILHTHARPARTHRQPGSSH